MKKVFQLLLVAVCFFVGSSTRVMAGDEKDKDNSYGVDASCRNSVMDSNVTHRA